jgi:PPOX class probable F420-dependent enzyme
VARAELSERARTFLAAPRFATIATIDRDGGPHQAVVWYLAEGKSLVVNSMVGRRWPANLGRDPRFSLIVEDGLEHIVLNGTAEQLADPEEAQQHIAAMARRYSSPEDAERMIEGFRGQRRVSFRLTPARVHEHW